MFLKADSAYLCPMIKKYLDFDDNEIVSPEGHDDYKVREESGVVVTTDHYLDGVLAFVTYSGIAADAVVAHHQTRGLSAQFQLHSADMIWFFEADGMLDHKTRHIAVSPNLQIDEELDTDDQLMRGTSYIIQDGKIRYAAEFDAERIYYNCFDFGTSEIVPIEQVRHLLG